MIQKVEGRVEGIQGSKQSGEEKEKSRRGIGRRRSNLAVSIISYLRKN